MSTSATKTWLMNYEILRLVNQLRRLINAEFGDKPLLSDAEIWRSLADYAGSSRSPGTQRVYAELRLALIKADDIDHPSAELPEGMQPAATSQRMYRGRPVDAPARDEARDEAPATAAAGSGKTITYRGQTMHVA
ncbi:MAG: hypothetical protein P1U64_09235 [Alcanivoracaceae bacterium]|nr:hypothetical protein [Alcanivoracaceae bacterium]